MILNIDEVMMESYHIDDCLYVYGSDIQSISRPKPTKNPLNSEREGYDGDGVK